MMIYYVPSFEVINPLDQYKYDKKTKNVALFVSNYLNYYNLLHFCLFIILVLVIF